MNAFAYTVYLGSSALCGVCASFDPQTRTCILKSTTPPAGVCLAASLPHIQFQACIGFFFHRGVYFKVALQIFVLQTEVDLPQATFTDTVRFRMAS